MINTTICAISTAPGSAAIAVIRLSGPNAIQIADKVFISKKEGKKLINQPPNTIHFGTIQDAEQVIDEVLISIFKAPYSYTGEDSVEISCHGSIYIQQSILQLLIKKGAILAKPGEYTQRAFMNGKMDLSQAEAVADLIASESASAHKIAMQQMRGGFSEEINLLRRELLGFISLIELELDFSEEDVEFADRQQLKRLIVQIEGLLSKLANSFHLGNVIKKGIPVAIVGKPNAGKSTLLNQLLNEDRAIVSEIEGTTRDAIEDTMVLDGITFRFIDTAGIRETIDKIETIGIERTFQKISQAEIVLVLLEADEQESMIREQVEKVEQAGKDKKIILLINKLDRTEYKIPAFFNQLKIKENDCIIGISAKHGHQMDVLTQELVNIVNLSPIKNNDVVISNVRHYQALKNALEAISRIKSSLEEMIPTDFLAIDIREALHYLGEITGEITTDEILGNIFKNFCIGK